jgi:ABC-type Fe3+/spermidine/putrescine transport system ATPase subunit
MERIAPFDSNAGKSVARLAAKSGTQPIVQFQSVTKRFGELAAVDDVSLDIFEGEFFALLGPSGCGKTTLLNLISGLLKPSQGRILFNGADVTNDTPEKRNIAANARGLRTT